MDYASEDLAFSCLNRLHIHLPFSFLEIVKVCTKIFLFKEHRQMLKNCMLTLTVTFICFSVLEVTVLTIANSCSVK